MTYKHIKRIDEDKDLIIPCRKGDLKELQSLISVNNLDFDAEFSTYQLFHGNKGNKIYVLGLGEENDKVKIGEAFRKLCFDTKKHWKKSIEVYAEQLTVDEVKKAVIGLEMATYEI